VRRLVLVVAALVCAASSPAARADTTTIGNLTLPVGGSTAALAANQLAFQLLAGDSNYVVASPVTGIIKSWSFRQTTMTPGDQVTLRVLGVDTGALTARALGTIDAQTVDGSGDVVRGPFAVSQAIVAGEVIAVESTSGSVPTNGGGIAGADEDFVDTPSLANGSSSPYENGNSQIPNQVQLEIQATVDYVPAAPPDNTPPPSTPPPVTPGAQLGSLPAPVEGHNVNLATVSGTVLVKVPGSKSFISLAQTGQQVPVGSDVDVTQGRLTMVAAAAPMGPATKTSDFYGGVFRVGQPASGKGRVDLTLDGPLATCTHFSGARAAKAKPPKKPKSRFVWGDGHGTFRTVGRHGSAAVTGTKWRVEDRCDDSTLVTVARGTVKVTDNVRHKTVAVKAGHSYLIRPRRH
jgi:hypothetical protein